MHAMVIINITFYARADCINTRTNNNNTYDERTGDMGIIIL